MDTIINALWELRTVFIFLVGVAGGLVIAALLMMARHNEEPDDGQATITIPPVEEPLGEQVDVRGLMRRYE